MVMEATLGQTKVPESDWSTERLGNRGVFFRGSGVRRNEATSGNLPCVRYGELYTQHHNIIADINSWISARVADDAQKIRKGDVLFAASGETKDEIGKCATLEVVDTAYAGGDIIVFRPFKDDPKFLGYFLNSPYVQQQKSAKAQGDAVVHISPKALADLSVQIPPYAEQVRIGEVLEEADALGEQLRQLVEKKRLIKHGAMQELLSARRRLPGFTGKWQKRRLGDLLAGQPEYGINAPAVPYDLRHPAYIRITDISEDGRFKPDCRMSVKHPRSDYYRLQFGDIVLARTGASTGKSYLYREHDGPLVFAGFLIRVHPNETELSALFLSYYLQTDTYWTWVQTNSMRSGQPGINGQQYASMPIFVPPTKREQDAIARILADMDAEIEALEARIEKARRIKQGMMQKLLTGKVRLV
jgi:type I restriction enzyme S subunit